MYFARALANQNADSQISTFFGAMASELESNAESIRAEFNGTQGKKVDLGGYYNLNDDKCNGIMRPSKAFNAIIEKIARG